MAEFLRVSSRKTFQLGEFDCGLFVADWCAEVRGIDPAAEIRGRYDTLEQALALTGTRTLPAMFDRLLRGAGLTRTRHLAYGDIAVIRIANGPPRGAIVTKGFVVVGEIGLSRVPLADARVVCSWSVFNA